MQLITIGIIRDIRFRVRSYQTSTTPGFYERRRAPDHLSTCLLVYRLSTGLLGSVAPRGDRNGHKAPDCGLQTNPYFLGQCLIASCAAARRATGTRKGEQLT